MRGMIIFYRRGEVLHLAKIHSFQDFIARRQSDWATTLNIIKQVFIILSSSQLK